jgi:DNA-binding NtrC family response regulator
MKEISSGELVLDEALSELENYCINMAMKMYAGNLTKVARVLHINRNTLHSRIQKNTAKGEK